MISLAGLNQKCNEKEVTVRWANALEWSDILQLVWKTFLKFEAPDYEEEGIKNFYTFLTDGNLYRSFIGGNYKVLVAICDGKIVGMCSLRSGNFLSLLFVDEEYHRIGVATKLVDEMCKYLRKEKNIAKLVVRSSPYARSFYQKIGFVSTGEEMHYSGIRVFPMEIEIGDF